MKDSDSSSGIPLIGALGLIFITLKLTGFIDWSWWYVTMPLWGGFSIALAFALIVLAIPRVIDFFRNFYKDGR